MQAIIWRRGKLWFLGNTKLNFGSVYPLEDDWEMVLRHTMSGFDKLRTDLAVRSKSGIAFGCIVEHDNCILITELGTVSIEEPTKANIQIGREALEALGKRSPSIHVHLTTLQDGDGLDELTFRASPSSVTINNFTDGSLVRQGQSHGRIQVHCQGATYLVRAQRHDGRQIFMIEIITEKKFNRAKLAQTLARLV